MRIAIASGKGGTGKTTVATNLARLAAADGCADETAGKPTKTTLVTPPPHEPGLLPRWLHEQGATAIIAGGMGQRAQQLFAESGIKVVVGAPADTAENLVAAYLGGTLVSGQNACDH